METKYKTELQGAIARAESAEEANARLQDQLNKMEMELNAARETSRILLKKIPNS